MKFTKTIFYLSLVMIMGLTAVTCQKEDAVMLIPEGETDNESPQLKSVVYNEFYWYHLDLTYFEICDLVAEGSLDKGNANALIVKYNAAKDNLWKGKYDTAEGILTAFINLVDALIEEGKILPAQGENLVQVPIGIIESFKHQCGDPVNDVRDGQSYETVLIGDQCWLAENLNYETDYSFYYNNDPVNGPLYGRLYHPNPDILHYACPIGWHLPSDEEWKILEKYLGMSETDADIAGIRYSGEVGRQLKSTSGWMYNGNGDNSSGFNALPGGRHILGNTEYFTGLGNEGVFVSSTMPTFHTYWARALYTGENVVGRRVSESRVAGSIRCVKNK